MAQGKEQPTVILAPRFTYFKKVFNKLVKTILIVRQQGHGCQCHINFDTVLATLGDCGLSENSKTGLSTVLAHDSIKSSCV